MLVARSYTVMDRVVVEISCVHGTDPAGSHLVIREERSGLPPTAEGMLRGLQDVAELARLLDSSERERLGLGSPCDSV